MTIRELEPHVLRHSSGALIVRPGVRLFPVEDTEPTPDDMVLLEGHDLDSVYRLSFLTNQYQIPEDINHVHFNGEKELTLVAHWRNEGVIKADLSDIVLSIRSHNLGRFFSIYTYGYSTLITKDGRIFHDLRLWEPDEDPRQISRLDRTLDLLDAYFNPLIGSRNPLQYTNIEAHRPNLQQIADRQ